MSKASDWAQKVRAAEDARREVSRNAPAGWTLHLDVSNQIAMTVGEDGQPNFTIKTKNNPAENYRPEIKRLVEAAHWILDTFEDKTAR